MHVVALTVLLHATSAASRASTTRRGGIAAEEAQHSSPWTRARGGRCSDISVAQLGDLATWSSVAQNSNSDAPASAELPMWGAPVLPPLAAPRAAPSVWASGRAPVLSRAAPASAREPAPVPLDPLRAAVAQPPAPRQHGSLPEISPRVRRDAARPEFIQLAPWRAGAAQTIDSDRLRDGKRGRIAEPTRRRVAMAPRRPRRVPLARAKAAARRIQRAWRRYIARQRLLEARDAALATLRTHLPPLVDYRRTRRRAASYIQGRARQRQWEKGEEERLRAALLARLNALSDLDGELVRKLREHAVRVVQPYARGHSVRATHRRLRKLRHVHEVAAIVRIQCCWRRRLRERTLKRSTRASPEPPMIPLVLSVMAAPKPAPATRKLRAAVDAMRWARSRQCPCCFDPSFWAKHVKCDSCGADRIAGRGVLWENRINSLY